MWGTSNLLLVLNSNKFQILSRKQKLWRDLKSKIYDFSQVKGDFVNMIQLKQYKRENVVKDLCSSIFMSLHMGHQVVLWELTNFPKIKMKMLWFYVIQDHVVGDKSIPLQPFCAAELSQIQPLDISLEKVETDGNFGQLKGDVAMGFEQGFVKIFDFSHHFADSRLDEMKQSLFPSQSIHKRSSLFIQSESQLPV